MKRFTSLYTVNVLPRWDAFLREFIKDIPHMSTDTLMMMQNNYFVRAELVRRECIQPSHIVPSSDGVDEDQNERVDDVCYTSDVDDDDFVPFGEDGKLPKHLRKW